ncbi:MAG: hypothetical protein ABI675_20600 [Chitinophagaceae bacterium]
MKKISPVVICFITIMLSSANAQEFSISWGQNTKDDSFGDAIVLPNGNYLLLKQPKIGRATDPVLMVIDRDMQVVKEAPFEIPEKDVVSMDLKRFGGNAFYAYQVQNKKETSVYAVKLNQQTLQQEGKFTLGTFDADGFGSYLKFLFKFSPDSSKVALFVEGFAKKKENKQFYAAVFDTNLKRIWGRYIELPFGGYEVTIEDQDITNEGKLFVAVKNYQKQVNPYFIKNFENQKVPPYDYKIFVYSNQGAPRQIGINLPSHLVAGTRLVFEKNGSTTIAGLYKKNPNGNVAGAFYTNFDSVITEVNENKLLVFPQEILELVDKDGMGKSKGSDPGIYDYLRLRQIIPRNNGSVDLVSEVQTETVTTQSDRNQFFYGKEYRRYGYGDIIILNMDKERRTRFTRVPKGQEGYQSEWGLGYFPFVYADKLILLYNDHVDNIDKDLSKSPEHLAGSFKKCVLAAAIIDEKGNVTRKAIYNYRDDKRLALPKNFSRLSDTKVLIHSITGAFMSYRLGFGLLSIK